MIYLVNLIILAQVIDPTGLLKKSEEYGLLVFMLLFFSVALATYVVFLTKKLIDLAEKISGVIANNNTALVNLTDEIKGLDTSIKQIPKELREELKEYLKKD